MHPMPPPINICCGYPRVQCTAPGPHHSYPPWRGDFLSSQHDGKHQLGAAVWWIHCVREHTILAKTGRCPLPAKSIPRPRRRFEVPLSAAILRCFLEPQRLIQVIRLLCSLLGPSPLRGPRLHTAAPCPHALAQRRCSMCRMPAVWQCCSLPLAAHLLPALTVRQQVQERTRSA